MPRCDEVWWLRLDPTIGSVIRKTRPCVVLTSGILNERRRTAVLIPVECGGGPAVAVIDQIRAMAKERFDRRIGVLSADHLAAIEDGVREILEL